MKILENKKKVIIAISLAIILCILSVTIIWFYNNSILVSSNANITEINNFDNSNNEIDIPNVTKENTDLKISDTKNKVKSVNISASKRLEDYNLYYFVLFDNTEASEINDADYSILNDTILLIDENCTIYFKYELDGNYSNENYKVKISNIKVQKTTTEKVSEEELKKENVNKNDIAQQSTSPYYIKINYGANVVTIYTKDSDGKYTVPYKAMVCSCGKYTPKSGIYKTSDKYTWRPLIHDVYGQYATRIVNKILFHSVPYSSNKKDTLLYEEYDKLGTKASEGCVRLTVQDAKWIYDNCPRGTMVEFYSDSNPGPLGKPSAPKISSVTECRNWDPTDPASENPWHTYAPEEDTTVPDVPTTDTPTSDIPTTDIPATDTPTTDTPSTDTPSTDTPSTDAPSTDTPSTDTPGTDTPNTDTPSTDTPNADIPSTDTPTTDTPTTDIPSADIPSTDTPITDIPTTDAPTTDTPNADTPSTDAPSTDTPSTDTPSDDTTSTDIPIGSDTLDNI